MSACGTVVLPGYSFVCGDSADDGHIKLCDTCERERAERIEAAARALVVEWDRVLDVLQDCVPITTSRVEPHVTELRAALDGSGGGT